MRHFWRVCQEKKYAKYGSFMDTIEKRLRYIRKNNGLSQKEFAEKIGVSFRTAQRYETNADNLSVKMVSKIASIFGVNESWLFLGVGDPIQTGTQGDGIRIFEPVQPGMTKGIVRFFENTNSSFGKNNDLMFKINKLSSKDLKEVKSFIEFKTHKKK